MWQDISMPFMWQDIAMPFINGGWEMIIDECWAFLKLWCAAFVSLPIVELPRRNHTLCFAKCAGDLHSLCTVCAGAGRCAEKAYFKPVPTRWPQGVCLSGVPMCVRKGVLLCMLMWACIVYLIFCTHYHPSYKLCIILDEVAQVVECFTGVTSKQSRMALQITRHALVP